MDVVSIIERKRDGLELEAIEIEGFTHGFCEGHIPDYQMSALAMAITLRGMTITETECLVKAMIASGSTVPRPKTSRPVVDKHSTGGVGDKLTLIVAPLACSLGVAVPKLSGRALGFAGGTIDKLESIPGYQTNLSIQEFVDQVEKIGVSIASATDELVPADHHIYALRDVTGTVRSMPLIAASIMSKKLAVGSDAIVLDIKVGSGAFFPTLDEASEFAELCLALGATFGRRVDASLTAMDRPLGHAIGNALEVREAINVLRGQYCQDVTELAIFIVAQMLVAGGMAADLQNAKTISERELSSGNAFAVFEKWVAVQGGDLDKMFSELENVPYQHAVVSESHGIVSRIDPTDVGRLAMSLGAGRSTKLDNIDYGAGVELHVSVGDVVKKGDRLATLHSNRPFDSQSAEQNLRRTVDLGEGDRPNFGLILQTCSNVNLLQSN